MSPVNFVKLLVYFANFVKMLANSTKFVKLLANFVNFMNFFPTSTNFVKLFAASTQVGITQGNFLVRFDRLTFLEIFYITTTLLSGCYL